MSHGLILHGYWRSSAAYRVRIALNLKGIDFSQITHDLRKGAQKAPAYRAAAPQGLVPALVVDNGDEGAHCFTQSPAIIEWLEERYPAPPLLPADSDGRAVVRSMAAIVACDIHPLNNLRVLNHLRSGFGVDAEGIRRWMAEWMGEGLAALEVLVARHGAGYCFGAAPTLADCYLVPQLYAAQRFSIDLAPYSALVAAGAAARALPAFLNAHPDVQPDADR